MATFDELFGKKSGGGKYLKWENVDDAFYMVVTGEPDGRYPQRDFKTGKGKFLVKLADAAKYKPMREGEFDPDSEDVENYFALTTLMIPVKVFRKVLPTGQDDETFEEFETEWILTDEQTEKLKDQMLETKVPIEAGTIIADKLLVKGGNGNYSKHMIRLQAAE